MYQELKAKANRGSPVPFLFEQFNVFSFYTSLLHSRYNALIRLQEALIEGLNRRAVMPQLILMIPHVSILNHVQFDLLGITHQLSQCINSFAIQID